MRHVRMGLLFWLSLVALAQSGSIGTGVVAIGGAGGPGIRGIQGIPFSADVTTETTRILADGNRIHRVDHGKICRDSQGRTRNENSFTGLPDGQPIEHVWINDPLERVFINLDMQGKTANVVHFPALTQTLQSRPSTQITSAPKPPPFTVHHEKLGTMYIEGILVNGTKITRTAEAGLMGNDQPLVTVIENWASEELKETLLSKTDDPQSGQTVRTLSNIQRGEPDPSLFQVPAGFTVHDQQ